MSDPIDLAAEFSIGVVRVLQLLQGDNSSGMCRADRAVERPAVALRYVPAAAQSRVIQFLTQGGMRPERPRACKRVVRASRPAVKHTLS